MLLLGLSVGGLQSTWLSVNDTGTHTASPTVMSKSVRRLPRSKCCPCDNAIVTDTLALFGNANDSIHVCNELAFSVSFLLFSPSSETRNTCTRKNMPHFTEQEKLHSTNNKLFATLIPEPSESFAIASMRNPISIVTTSLIRQKCTFYHFRSLLHYTGVNANISYLYQHPFRPNFVYNNLLFPSHFHLF